MNILKNNRLNYFILFIIAIFTLNSQDHSLNAGLDGSYFWAFNYLFEYNYKNLDKITFIYGPLAFLHTPLHYGNLICFGVLFQLIVKTSYGILILKLTERLSVKTIIGILVYGASCLTVFSAENYFNLSIILLLLLYHLESKKLLLFFLATYTVFGYYYKCSFGLSAIVLQGIYWIYKLISEKKADYKFLFQLIYINLILFLAVGLMLFRSFIPIIDSVKIYFQNIISFNEASSISNGFDNPVLLVICAISLFTIFCLKAKNIFRLFWILSIFFLYTGYTHSIVRMDHSHYIGFLQNLFLVGCLLVLFYSQISKYAYLLAGVAFYSYYTNLNTKKDFSEFFLSIPNGIANFNNYMFSKNYHKKIKKQSVLNLKHTYKLSPQILLEITKDSVDFFPWDLMYIEANKLTNWKPRPYLQNLNMSSYFDKETAKYFASRTAPHYLLWHSGSANEFLMGIDHSYLLNNEFNSVLSILSNYKVIAKDEKILLLERNEKATKILLKSESELKQINSHEWIKLPESENIVGCSLNYDFNPLRGIKKQFYRDDEFYVEYKTATNQKFKRRIWPRDAKDFIWLNPFIVKPNDSLNYKEITHVRFTNTHPSIHSGKLSIQFKSIVINSEESHGSKKALYHWMNPSTN